MVQKNLGTGDYTTASGAAGVDNIVAIVGGTVQELPLSKLPVSEAAQTMFDPSAMRDRATHTGDDPAGNVVFLNGETLEAWRIAVETILAGISSSAPVNTVVPSAPSGSLSVGSTLTASQGTWTGASTYAYQWRRTGAAITGATATTYVLVADDAGLFITCTVTATATNLLSNSATSPAVGPVTATLPTISVAPAVTPSGSQAINTLLTTTDGTWNDAGSAVYTYQWFLNSVAIAFATTNTYTPVTGQEGGTILVKVTATTAQGSSTPASSNSITVTGSATIVNTVAPAWSGTLEFGVANDFTEGTWTGAIDAVRNWSFFRNSEVTPYVSPPNTNSIHTPRVPAVVGDTLYIEETVFETATSTAYKARSAGAVIQAGPDPLVPLPALTYPVWGAVTPNTSAVFNPADTLTFGGTVRMQRVPDPGGSGRNVYLHRVLKSDAGMSGGTSTIVTRAEKQYIYQADGYFWPALDYWFCFAVRTKSGEYATSDDGIAPNNVHLVWQGHTQAGGAAQPMMALIHDIGHNWRYWRRAYNSVNSTTWISNGSKAVSGATNASPIVITTTTAHGIVNNGTANITVSGVGGNTNANGTHTVNVLSTTTFSLLGTTGNGTYTSGGTVVSPDNEGQEDVIIGAYPTPDVWYKYIVHYRPGWTDAHQPRMEVWEAIANDTYTKVVEHIADSDWNEFNHATGSYNRIGIYKWLTHWENATTSVAIHATEVYSRNNTGATSYFNEAKATLVGL